MGETWRRRSAERMWVRWANRGDVSRFGDLIGRWSWDNQWTRAFVVPVLALEHGRGDAIGPAGGDLEARGDAIGQAGGDREARGDTIGGRAGHGDGRGHASGGRGGRGAGGGDAIE